MTLQEFQESIGGKHATVMICQVDGSQDNGHTYNAGDMVNVELRKAFALNKQMANAPKKGDPDIHRWVPKDVTMTTGEMALLNKHFENEFQQESGEKPLQIKKHKK